VCGHTEVHDVVDVSVVLCARERGDTIVTLDRADLRRIDSKVQLVAL
jgi:predicted nucleic acid-binding protein